MNDLDNPIYSLHKDNANLAPLVADFVADLATTAAALRSAATASDRRSLGQLSHRFRGEAATYGYPELATAIEELEESPPPSWLARLACIDAVIERIQRGLQVSPVGDAKKKPLHEVSALIVDDSEPLRLLISHLLKSIGIAAVELATGGLAALGRCQESSFDILIVDLQMPDLPGKDLIGKLRQQGVACPAIAISADDSPSQRRECLSSGFDAFICKPFTQAQLAETLRRVFP